LIAVASPPPVVPPVPGASLSIAGEGLDLAAAAQVFLSIPGTATEWDVTTWRQGVTAGVLDLIFPDVYADPSTFTPAPPAAMAPPGAYNLAVGAGTSRSNTIPILIAPRVDGVVNPPQLTPNAIGVYAISGAGFAPATTTLSFGATPLTYTAAPTPAAGQFTVSGGGTIDFVAPATATHGSYPILLAVNGVAATTGWVVLL